MSKNLVFGELAKNKTFKLYSWEPPMVRAYIKKIRIEKKAQMKGIRNETK